MSGRLNSSYAQTMRSHGAIAALTCLMFLVPYLLRAEEGTEFKVEETSIAGLEAAYLSGKTTAHAVTQAYFNRIAAYDERGPLINALITVNPHALEEADRLDAMLKATGKPVGPLHGIPVIVKDNIDVMGLPMTSSRDLGGLRSSIEPTPCASTGK